MPKYLVLYKADGSGTGEPSAEEHQAWLDWNDAAGDAIVDFGAPTISVPGGGGADVIGYSIVQAETLGALDAVFDANPHHRQGGTIEVHEIHELPGE